MDTLPPHDNKSNTSRKEPLSFECEHCHKYYTVRYALGIRTKKHFCSRTCYAEYSKRREIKTCCTCGKEFESRSNKSLTRMFCSSECRTQYSKVTLTCKQCGKEYILNKGELRSNREFCTRECRSKYFSGEKNHNYNGGDETCLCQWCGEEFKSPPSHIKRGRGKFCSRTCRSRYTVCKQGGMVSSIEIMVKEELEKRKEPYHHQYRIDRFLVDFYLPTRNVVIECDGTYWHSLEKNHKNDIKKNVYMEEAGINLVRLPEPDIKQRCASCIDDIFKQYPNI